MASDPSRKGMKKRKKTSGRPKAAKGGIPPKPVFGDDRAGEMASVLGDMFRDHLEKSGMTKELDAWDRLMKEARGRQGFTQETAASERRQAWKRFSLGDPQGAVKQLQDLVERLRATTDFDPAFQLALTSTLLGRLLIEAISFAQAIPVLRDARQQWETLAEKAGGRPWEELLTSSDPETAMVELVNLGATMGDLANALSSAGEHDEALAVAEKSLMFQIKHKDQYQVATGHGLCASIIMAAGRYEGADSRYELALAAARETGNLSLEGDLLVHQGVLAGERDQLERVGTLYRQALERYQAAGDPQGMMRAYNLLALDDRKAGRLAEARAWYETAHELAGQRKDQAGLREAARHIGAIRQLEGEGARILGDEPAALRHFEEARRSLEQSR